MEAEKIKRIESIRAEGMEHLYSKDPAIRDLQKALAKFQEGAELGDPVSMDQLGGFYAMGMAGLEKNCAKALEWFEKSARMGYPLAMNNLAYTLTTCPDKKLRDVDKAEALVQTLFQSNPGFLALLDTYATILAEQGNFKQAAKTLEVVLDVADLAKANPERIDEIKGVLRLYKRKKKPQF